MKYIITLIFLCAAHWLLAQNKQDTITNKTVIDLKKVGLSTDIIKAKINTSICVFDMTVEGLIALKKAQVSEDVITLMMEKQSGIVTTSYASLPPPTTSPKSDAKSTTKSSATKFGIYYIKNGSHIEVEPTVYASENAGSGLLTRLTYGIAKTKLKATLSGDKAHLQITDTLPTFYFYFNTSNDNNFGNNSAYSHWFSGASSPNEFMLIKFDISKSKSNREVVTASSNSYEGLSTGIDEAFKVKFNYTKMGDGVYRVHFDKALLKGGEYCFMYIGGSATRGTQIQQKVYDFGVGK